MDIYDSQTYFLSKIFYTNMLNNFFLQKFIIFTDIIPIEMQNIIYADLFCKYSHSHMICVKDNL